MKRDLDKFILIGDRILLTHKKHSKTTKAGLFLPPGVKEKESIQFGYVEKVGPGYPIPMPRESDEDWKPAKEEASYIPLQPRHGDLAIYLQDSAYEFEYEGQKYIIVSQHSILLLIREDY